MTCWPIKINLTNPRFRPGVLKRTMMLTSITQPWGFMRIIRLVIGGYALVEAYRGQDSLMAIFGIVLVGMAVLNAGCGAQGCGIPTNKSNQTESEDVDYEEVHSK